MDFKPSPAVESLLERIDAFMAEHVYPQELEVMRALDDEVEPGVPYPQILVELRAKAREEGLWNLFIADDEHGAGLTNWEYGMLCEQMGRSPVAAPMSFNCAAPDTGNAEILIDHGSDEQKAEFLAPLLEGEARSCFSMTEPEVSGSDPTTLQTCADLDGDEWVINGHKWFTSNGKRADFFIVMCRTDDPNGPADRNGKMTQIIVPKKTPGVNIVRSVPVWGHDGDHCEIIYDNVRVPVENQLGKTGSGHAAAQDRLGAGRVYHCMNSIGQMWRAFDLMVQRMATREVHGGKLATKQFMQGFIADSYIDLQAARLMTIHCAERMDVGLDARTEISAIKIFVPEAYTRVVDRAIQVWGAAGVSGDLPLAGMYQGARTLRIADGPDEVHKILIAKNVLKRYADGEGWDFGN